MINDKVLKALNQQLNVELFSSYTYLSMSAYFDTQSFNGFAKWMRLQSQEEYAHAMKIYDYIHQRDGRVELMKIDVPKLDWKTPLAVFEETFDHEQKVTESINKIVELCLAEKDYATHTFLQWFLNEQVEEEATALNLLDKMRLAGDNKNGLFLLDRDFGSRS